MIYFFLITTRSLLIEFGYGCVCNIREDVKSRLNWAMLTVLQSRIFCLHFSYLNIEIYRTVIKVKVKSTAP